MKIWLSASCIDWHEFDKIPDVLRCDAFGIVLPVTISTWENKRLPFKKEKVKNENPWA